MLFKLFVVLNYIKKIYSLFFLIFFFFFLDFKSNEDLADAIKQALLHPDNHELREDSEGMVCVVLS